MDYSKIINEGEHVEYVAEQSKKAYFKNLLLANLFYIVLWIGFDVFFIYIIAMKSITEQFWFVTISVAGLNLLRVWTLAFKILKDFAELKVTSYIITDAAVYEYKNGKFKDLKRISFEEIIVVEKSEYYFDGFYIGSGNKTIKVIYINEQEMFQKIVKKVQTSEK